MRQHIGSRTFLRALGAAGFAAMIYGCGTDQGTTSPPATPPVVPMELQDDPPIELCGMPTRLRSVTTASFWFNDGSGKGADNMGCGTVDHKCSVGGDGDVHECFMQLISLAGFPAITPNVDDPGQGEEAFLVLTAQTNDRGRTTVPVHAYTLPRTWNLEAVGPYDGLCWPNRPPMGDRLTEKPVPVPDVGVPIRIPITAAYVGWLADPKTNFGIKLRATSNNAEFDNFSTCLAKDQSTWPKLIVRRFKPKK